jgi:hypothetical protein
MRHSAANGQLSVHVNCLNIFLFLFFFCCTVHSDIHTVHSPANALFVAPSIPISIQFTLQQMHFSLHRAFWYPYSSLSNKCTFSCTVHSDIHTVHSPANALFVAPCIPISIQFTLQQMHFLLNFSFCLNIICYKPLEGCDASPFVTAPVVWTYRTWVLLRRNEALY